MLLFKMLLARLLYRVSQITCQLFINRKIQDIQKHFMGTFLILVFVKKTFYCHHFPICLLPLFVNGKYLCYYVFDSTCLNNFYLYPFFWKSYGYDAVLCQSLKLGSFYLHISFIFGPYGQGSKNNFFGNFISRVYSNL